MTSHPRTRIISALALGTVVVEAADRSASLISARTALEQNREVMAVPGRPSTLALRGTKRLIQKGARLFCSGDDILKIMTLFAGTNLKVPSPPCYLEEVDMDAPPAHQVEAVRKALSPTPLQLDEIARATNIDPARCAAILKELKLYGEANTLPGGLTRSAL